MTSPKSHNVGGEFDHPVTYPMACTFENEDLGAMEYGRIRFGSLNEMINDDDFECFDKRL